MTTTSLTLLPFYTQLPAGAFGAASPSAPASDAGTGAAASASASAPKDVVSIRGGILTGNLTAAAGDRFTLSDLYTATAPGGGSIAGYRVALRGGGALSLNGVDVTAQTSFTADQFARLQFTAGAPGSAQDLVVVAQTGTRHADGSLTAVTDSPAVQITASVTGTRSINAAGALVTAATGDDANVVAVAKEAAIFTGFGTTARPSLATAGNLTAAAGDRFTLSDLYTATAPGGGSIAGYRVALRGGGALSLNGVDVTAQTSFTADQFARLQFTAGAPGSAQDLVVVAQTGTRHADGSLTAVTDSPAVQITASVTGTRSINAAGALVTAATGDDANVVAVAKEAAIFTGFGTTARPSLATAGNLTAAAGDRFTLSDLYTATAPGGGSIAGYRVALRGGGALSLNGVDVTAQTSFTADQFARLQFTAGAPGSAQDLVVVAQTGTRQADGSLTAVTDSPAVQITASVTGTRSINAAGALVTAATGDDANVVAVAKEAAIFTGFGTTARPSLATAGNLTAAAGDRFTLSDLYTATAPGGGSIAGYRVALRGGGALSLNGVDVTAQTSFTADQFARLQFTAGAPGSAQDLVVVAQTGTRHADGSLTAVTDSPAVQITASVTGTRSINAAGALVTAATGDDANVVAVAKEAAIFTGFGTTARPSLATAGNLTAAAGDRFTLSDLYTATAPGGGSIAGYRVALRGGGALSLNGVDVTAQTSFTADQFARLQFTAGAPGSAQDLVVVAQTGTRQADGSLTAVTDSPAVQITASVTGTRSINAAGALVTAATGDDANVVAVAKEASIFTGFGTTTRPGLSSVGTPADPSVPAAQLGQQVGVFQSSQPPPASTTSSPAASANATAPTTTGIDLSQLYPDAVGGSQSSAASSAATVATWLLDRSEVQGYQTTGATTAQQLFAITAYQATQRSS